MQVLAGTGIVGGLLLVGFAATTVAAARRPLRAGPEQERLAAVALAGLPAAYALHALVDYDADFLAVTAPTLLAVGTLLGAGRPLVRPRAGAVPALAVLVAGAAAVVSLALPWLATRRVDDSYAASDAGRVAEAERDARDARSLNPLSPEPLYALAQARQAARDLPGARAAWTRATTLQPENPDTWWNLGLFEYVQARDMCAAYQALNHSYTLDPKSTRWAPGAELDQARDAVNNGACG
jgi:tetratricopeptide (TPR) repeat protein